MVVAPCGRGSGAPQPSVRATGRVNVRASPILPVGEPSPPRTRQRTEAASFSQGWAPVLLRPVRWSTPLDTNWPTHREPPLRFEAPVLGRKLVRRHVRFSGLRRCCHGCFDHIGGNLLPPGRSNACKITLYFRTRNYTNFDNYIYFPFSNFS